MDKVEFLKDENRRLHKRQNKLLDLLQRITEYAEKKEDEELDEILTEGLYELALNSLKTLSDFIDVLEREKYDDAR